MNKLNKEKFPPLAEQEGLKLETRDNGNLLVIYGKTEKLVETASQICKELDPGITFDIAESLKNGEELRPQGVYAVWIDRKQAEMRVQNRNARGNKGFNEKMLEAVKKVL